MIKFESISLTKLSALFPSSMTTGLFEDETEGSEIETVETVEVAAE